MDPRRWLLDISEPKLEKVLLPIDVMYLRGRYFRWESPAYHGLAELRLATSGMYSESKVPINSTDIAKILAASPRLRLLHFGLRIEGPHLPCQPTPLQELEVLNLWSVGADQCEIILQLIDPGPKPLQVLLRIPAREDLSTPLFGLGYTEFFSRSNIAELKIGEGHDGYPHQLPELLGALALPRLRVLALHQFALDLDDRFSGDRSYPPIAAFACSRLEILQFSNCAIDMYDLQWAAEVFPISQVQVSGGSLVSAGIGETHGTGDVQNELVKTFPTIYPNPVPWQLLLRRWDRWTALD